MLGLAFILPPIIDFYGCPKNFLHAEPDYDLLSYLIAYAIIAPPYGDNLTYPLSPSYSYLITQVGVLFMQDVLGPRWFIPKRVLL